MLIFGRIADTVNGGHGGDDNHVVARHQVFGGGKAHLLDVFVDRTVFFDEQIAAGHIGFGLVIVVVGNEIFHRVFGEKLAHFGIELGSKGFVVCHDDGGTAALGDDICHGVGFARTGYTEQGLIGQAV